MINAVQSTIHALLPVACTLLVATTAGCSGSSSSTTGSESSALTALVMVATDGGIDTGVSTCLTSYVDCLRVAGSDAAACKSTLLTCASATPATTADGGTATHACGGGQGGLVDDGDADDVAIAACLTTLDTCAAGADTADTCVAAATTCLAAARPAHTRTSR